jgi:hypothetical protein
LLLLARRSLNFQKRADKTELNVIIPQFLPFQFYNFLTIRMVTFNEVPDTVLNIYLEEIDGLKKVTAT